MNLKHATLIDVVQGSPEWLQARAGVATASHFAEILSKGRGGGESVGRKDYRYKLVAERLTGFYIQNGWTSAEMQWGTNNEPVAALEFSLETGLPVQEVGFIKLDYLEAGASLDRLVGDDQLLEIKAPKTSTHVQYLEKGEMPTKYKAQVQGQLWISERKSGYFMSYDPRLPSNLSKMIVKVERDEEYIQMLATEVEQFLSEVDQTVAKLKGLGEKL